MQGRIIYGGLHGLQRELSKDQWQNVRYIILLDKNTFNHCLPKLVSIVEQLQDAEFIEVPVGEECKEIEIAQQVWQTMLENNYDRNAMIINLGGGCVSDIGGFVAAGYMRGIRYVNVPTSLVGMIDASVGGKTAVNLHGTKNIIGYFYQPEMTCIESSFLRSLPREELISGYMEMVKTAVVADTELYKSLLTDIKTPDKSSINQVVKIKVAVVQNDLEDHGTRKILNFGHTFGHAIEAYSYRQCKPLSHGISIGIGMMIAMYLSTRKIGLSYETYTSYSKWLRKYVPLQKYNLKDIEEMLVLMHRDKKNAEGEIRCILLQDIGAAMIDVTVDDNEIRDAILKLGR